MFGIRLRKLVFQFSSNPSDTSPSDLRREKKCSFLFPCFKNSANLTQTHKAEMSRTRL